MNTMDLNNRNSEEEIAQTAQFSTFFVAGRLYGIDVQEVQEVTRTLPITQIPLSPPFIKGLINLRGQIATAIGLRELFGLEPNSTGESMNVVCSTEGVLISLLVDKIGDVIEVSPDSFEPAPDTIGANIRRFMQGVHKISGPLLSVIEAHKIVTALNDKNFLDNK